MFGWQVILKQILWDFCLDALLLTFATATESPLFLGVFQSSHTTLLGLFRATLKEIMAVDSLPDHNSSTLL